ncbi:hypothetical protein CRENBAI_013052, partial [Crenichthys baileyi]
MKSEGQKDNLSHSAVAMRQHLSILSFSGSDIILTFRLLSSSSKNHLVPQLSIFLMMDLSQQQHLDP